MPRILVGVFPAIICPMVRSAHVTSVTSGVPLQLLPLGGKKGREAKMSGAWVVNMARNALGEVQAKVGLDNFTIRDRDFDIRLRKLKLVKKFLVDSNNVQVPDDVKSKLDLGDLNNMTFGYIGRKPTRTEWSDLDDRLYILLRCLPEGAWKDLKIGQLGVYFDGLPFIFLGLALSAVLVCFLVPAALGLHTLDDLDQSAWYMRLAVFYVSAAWALSLGALGACAFLGTRVISDVRGSDKKSGGDSDVNFDITNANLLRTRIVLGVLFAFLLGLPVAGHALNAIFSLMASTSAVFDPKKLFMSDLPMIVLPFVVGFSMNLVLQLMERFVSVIQSFLGSNTR
jgi:hypothetical protein